MNQVKTVNFKTMTSTQSQELIKYCVEQAQNDEKVSAKFADTLDGLQLLSGELDGQVKNGRASALTVDVRNAKLRLGYCYRCLELFVKARNIYSSTDAMKKSAHSLDLILKKHGIRRKMNQVDLHDLVYNLVDELSQDANAADVKAIGAEMPVKELMHENDEFSKALHNRTAKKPEAGSFHLNESRHKAEVAYRDFINKLNVVASMEKSTNYDAFIQLMNKEITFYKQNVISANKRAKTLAEKNLIEKPQEAPVSETTEAESDVTTQGPDKEVEAVG